ncbi:MAG TPA: hypothetical protein VLG38_03320 [Gammaproteobacteria bacterium]|nr:hypothetical protein [Gammaproteobacteria bacterium]
MGLRNVLLSITTFGLAVFVSVAHASYTDEAEFSTNGSIAQVLENNISQYLMPLEVQQIGNSVYNVGIVYGALGQEITSSSPQNDFVTKHMSGYCSPGLENQYFTCNSQAANLNNDTASAQMLEMGDVRTSVLLEPTMYTPVLTYAAQNYIRNITMPFPTQTYVNYISDSTTFAKNSNQRTAYATYMAGQAVLSVARYALDEMYAMRVSGNTIGGAANSGNAATDSIMQVMENEASRRFTDPGYQQWLTAGTTAQPDLLRDLAAMQAFSLWMDYQNYRQNERIAALLSAMLSNDTARTLQQAAITAQMGKR